MPLSSIILILFYVNVSSIPISSVHHHILLSLQFFSIIIILISLNYIPYILNNLHTTILHYIQSSFSLPPYSIILSLSSSLSSLSSTIFRKYSHRFFIEFSIHLSVVSFHRSPTDFRITILHHIKYSSQSSSIYSSFFIFSFSST